jgi:transcriptional regulator
MYVPEPFKEERVPVLHDAMRRIGFATLVSSGAAGLVASHVPLILAEDAGPLGTLYGHVARANDHWRDLGTVPQALAIFLGPDGYVTPSWYPTKQQTGKVVPTWNYVAVHAYGPIRLIEEQDRLLDLVTRLTDRHEGRRARPWQVSDAPESYVRGLLRAIVGLEMPIARLEGKWKLSQNRPVEDRAGVVQGLASADTEASRSLMEAMLAAPGERPRPD